jgi:hypothetical protein
VRDTGWKAQVRLCARYRRLSATGKKLPVAVAAIAREMAAFLWAIGREVAPAQGQPPLSFFCCPEPGVEHERCGTPVASALTRTEDSQGRRTVRVCWNGSDCLASPLGST